MPAKAPPVADYQLPVEGFTGTPEEIERQWFERCYKGRGDSMLQLTWRAVLMGSALGGVLSLTNLYIGLKSGWGFGVAITACILSYAIWTALRAISGRAATRIIAVLLMGGAVVSAWWVYPWAAHALSPQALSPTAAAGLAGLACAVIWGLVGSFVFYVLWGRLTPMTVLENNCMQSTASSAGYSTGGTLVSAIAAYILINGHSIPTATLMGWVFCLAVLGVTMAIPMKRQMINIEQLRFPSGVAAAETLRALHTTGGKAIQSAIALGIAGFLGAVSKFWSEGLELINQRWATWQLAGWFDRLSVLAVGKTWTDRTIQFTWQPMFIAAGAITGMRACLSMLIGGTLCWAVFVPIMQKNGTITSTEYTAILAWTLWGGAACMVTSGLLSFATQWRSALRAFRDLGQMFANTRGPTDPTQAAMDAVETPASWFLGGQLVGTIGLAYLAQTTFGMPYWLTIVAVLLSFALALVACRVCGETDNTPVGAMGKITQLTFGAISPGKMNVNLMSACITAGAADSSSDLLTDLKSGYLLGAHPRKQFLAQFAGIFIGTLVSVLSFNAIVTSPKVLGTAQFAAPAAQTWRAVAVALGEGLSSLHPVKVWGIVIGGLVGIALPLLALALPRYQKYLPSAAALGLAWTFSWDLSLLFFLGALIGWLIEKTAPKVSAQYTFSVASGVIAGESLVGVGVTFAKALSGG
jgi:OPT family oligopeptide transporter